MLVHIVEQAERLLSESNDFNVDITFKITQNFPDKRACHVHVQLIGSSEESADNAASTETAKK